MAPCGETRTCPSVGDAKSCVHLHAAFFISILILPVFHIKPATRRPDSMLSYRFLQPHCFKEAVSREKRCIIVSERGYNKAFSFRLQESIEFRTCARTERAKIHECCRRRRMKQTVSALLLRIFGKPALLDAFLLLKELEYTPEAAHAEDGCESARNRPA